MQRSAVDIVRAYGVDAWTQGRDDWIPDLCADPIIRHDANREVRLSHAEQRARMRHNYEELRPVFEVVVLAGDEEFVSLVWNVTGRDPKWKLCGIEIFRVVDQRIVEVWNSTYTDGRWGLSKSLGGSLAGGVAFALPLVQPDLVVGSERVTGRLLVPADATGIAAWLTHLFGRPVSAPAGALWQHRFARGGTPAPLALTVADTAGPATGLANITIPAFTIELERSGLVNAIVAIEADIAEPTAAGPFSSLAPGRLAETIGAFDGRGRVVDAAITIAADGAASGRMTLRIKGSDAPTGQGLLALGWRDGDRSLVFEGNASLSLLGAFADGDVTQASYEWQGSGFSATLVNAHREAVAADL